MKTIREIRGIFRYAFPVVLVPRCSHSFEENVKVREMRISKIRRQLFGTYLRDLEMRCESFHLSPDLVPFYFRFPTFPRISSRAATGNDANGSDKRWTCGCLLGCRSRRTAPKGTDSHLFHVIHAPGFIIPCWIGMNLYNQVGFWGPPFYTVGLAWLGDFHSFAPTPGVAIPFIAVRSTPVQGPLSYVLRLVSPRVPTVDLSEFASRPMANELFFIRMASCQCDTNVRNDTNRFRKPYNNEILDHSINEERE